jgi:hypothetical protein
MYNPGTDNDDIFYFCSAPRLMHKHCVRFYESLWLKTVNKLIVVLLLIPLNYVFGQNPLIQIESLPKGLKASIDKVDGPCVSMGIECIGTVTFSSSNKKVSYTVFNYTLSDSILFEKIESERMIMENCGWEVKRNLGENIPGSFVKGGYFFMVEFCACGGSKKRCKYLVRKLRKWQES